MVDERQVWKDFHIGCYVRKFTWKVFCMYLHFLFSTSVRQSRHGGCYVRKGHSYWPVSKDFGATVDGFMCPHKDTLECLL